MLTTLWLLAVIWTAINICRLWLICPARLQLQTGISIGLFSITWQTDYFNGWLNNNFNQFSRYNHRQVSTWYRLGQRYFKLGVWLTAACFPAAIYLIFNALYHSSLELFNCYYANNNLNESLTSSQSQAVSHGSNGQGLIIVLPGISVLGVEIFYFIFALAICSVIHEAGHALAAKMHRMQVESVGISLFICLPMAFVVIHSEPLEDELYNNGQKVRKLSSSKSMIFRQLEVVSAGLMNNVVLCLLTVIIAFYLNPMYLFYGTGNGGLLVTHVNPQSSLFSGPNALQLGEVITSINGRPLNSYEDWTEHLGTMLSNSDDSSHQRGFCVPSTFLESYSSSISAPCFAENCCNSNDSEASSKLCFLINTAQRKTFTGQAHPPQNCDLGPLLKSSNLQQYARKFAQLSSKAATIDSSAELANFALWHRKGCLPVRPISEAATQLCTRSADCAPTYFGDSACLHAYHATQPTVRLLVIAIEGRHSSLNILFWGSPVELLQAVKVSPLKPRLSLLPLSLPQQWDAFLRYLFSMSFSMILFNLIPLHPFDGYQLLHLSSLYCFRNNDLARQRVLSIAHLSACLLTLLCAIVGLVQLSQGLSR